MADTPPLPRRFKGAKRQISLVVPEGLLRLIDQTAKDHGLSRAELFTYGMAWVVERMAGAPTADGE